MVNGEGEEVDTLGVDFCDDCFACVCAFISAIEFVSCTLMVCNVRLFSKGLYCCICRRVYGTGGQWWYGYINCEIVEVGRRSGCGRRWEVNSNIGRAFACGCGEESAWFEVDGSIRSCKVCDGSEGLTDVEDGVSVAAVDGGFVPNAGAAGEEVVSGFVWCCATDACGVLGVGVYDGQAEFALH